MPAQFSVANKALLVNAQGRILIVRDRGTGEHANSKGNWDVPGGRMESGESPLEGLAREIREEVGIEIDPATARPFHVDRWGVGGDVVNHPIIGLFSIIQIGSVEPHLSDEHTEYQWLDPRQPYAETMRPAFQRMMDAYRRVEGIELVTGSIRHEGFGLIQVFTGNGKGKTTAALGTALRAVAIGKKVAMVSFDKGGESHYSERSLIRERLPEIDLFPTGLDRIDPVTKKFRFGVTDEDRREGERGLAIVKKLFAEKQHDLIVLDEINSSADLGIVNETDVLALLDQKPETVELILTGRQAPAPFIKKADLATEMKLLKHYFYQGVSAREGLDY